MRAVAETRAWVDRAVIGLNLCPFAKAPQVKGLIRYVASDARDDEALLATFDRGSAAPGRDARGRHRDDA